MLSYLKHVANGQVKQIHVEVKNIYRIDVDACVTLSSKPKHVQGRDDGEIWNRHMRHLHHGALK